MAKLLGVKTLGEQLSLDDPDDFIRLKGHH